jgi:glycosyltransferase involved in cell wall biosynthesis
MTRPRRLRHTLTAATKLARALARPQPSRQPRPLPTLAATSALATTSALAVTSALAANGVVNGRPTPNHDPNRRSVWLVNQYAITPEMPGINRHYELGWLLGRYDWDATVFAAALHHTLSQVQRDVSLLRPVLWEQLDGVRFCWLYTTPYRKNDWRRYVNMLSFMISFTGAMLFAPRPDVIIGSSPHLLAGLGAWLASVRHRVPFLFEVRDMWPDMLIQLGLTNPLVIKPLLWIERFLYNRATYVIALSDGIAERIIRKGIPAEKVTVIPNSLLPAEDLDEAKRQAKRRELGWDDRVVAAWAGAHNPMNGLDVVVEAARLLVDEPSIHIVFIGDGSLKQDLIEQAKGLPNVTFYDPLPKSEIGEFLRAADIGLIHSRRFEAFTGTRPNKLFEYMSAGLPMVSTVPGEAWRLIAEANAGIPAEWENPASLANALRELAHDPERRKLLGRNGHAHVREVHNRGSHAAKLATLLDKIAPLPASTAPRAPQALEPATSQN